MQLINVVIVLTTLISSAHGRTHLLSLLQSMEDSGVASGRITKTELKKHMTALSEHLADPETTLIDKLVVQAWGQKRS